jgi:hypothetical protein
MRIRSVHVGTSRAAREVPCIALYCIVGQLLVASLASAQADPVDPEPADANPPPAAVDTQVQPAAAEPATSPVVTSVPAEENKIPFTAPDAVEEAVKPGATDAFEAEVGGGLILYYYQPLEGDGDNFFEIFEARLRLDARFDIYRLHITPRFRNTKERAFFPGISWVEEAYAAAQLGPVEIKVGKVYRQFGRFWDNSFYGNAQEYDGLKLDPNHGVSIEGALGAEESFGLAFFAQYFIVDGTTNYSLPDRDTVSIPGARRRNQLVGRVEPFLKLSEQTTIKLGVSGEYFQAADLPGFGTEDVARLGVDATFAYSGLTLWAEYIAQLGRHVVGFPYASIPADGSEPAVPGRSSDEVHYLMLGGELELGRFTLRYNFNSGDYTEVDYAETRHVPGVQVSLEEHLFVLLEWAYAQKHEGDADSEVLDNSLNLTIHGKI